MKRMVLVAVLLAGLGWVACGGGGGSGGNCDAATDTIIAAFDEFDALTQVPEVQYCINQEQTTCPCPGGGTAVANVANRTLTLTNCMDANGHSFSGVFTFNEEMTELNATMSTFGQCTSGTGSNIQLSGCGGTLSATCDGTGVNCTIVDDPASAQGCTLDCSC